MAATGLRVRVGQHGDAGRKPGNQDCCGAAVPTGAALSAKGVVVALADGISSSEAGHLASQCAVTGFLDDYYCTPDAWSVRHSAQRVLAAINSWLFAQTQQGAGRWDKDRGWVCTFSALVLHGRTAHVFHVGDARVWQLHGTSLEPLTIDHSLPAGGGRTYLGRALGIADQVEIDHRMLPLAEGDTFVLATDGVHAFLRPGAIAALLASHADPQAAATAIVQAALDAGSDDNVTAQIVRIDQVPAAERSELQQLAAALPLPPELSPRMLVDGLRIVRPLHASARSHVWLAVDETTQERVALKVPSTEAGDDARWRERFLLEEWVARRVSSPHLLQPRRLDQPRSSLYVAFEYLEGPTLAQWRLDHPKPALDSVRSLVAQLARGLRALHRLAMVHGDLRPENVIVDATGTARIIDFGSVQVAGLHDDRDGDGRVEGTLQFMAPECLRGAPGSARSDLFSLAALAYHLLCGQLPYDTTMARDRSEAAQRRMRYRPLGPLRPDVPAWIDDALVKALHPDASRRFADADEFVHALSHPPPHAPTLRKPALAERDPVLFWKALSLLLGIACIVLLGWRATGLH
ncbi:bifunctional protein-serine/threonine kinase/phosphatase [Ramlibacter algicola]|uniref:Protein kinase n=1 Tax=Ramlibacter algicola TaxID=2795217 RepID=A0A934Q0H2_9BURK|nr:bifunctional protein-serine/threonine kinase/phosphatase [Ramlibacter algicola]MBK0393950.1 protein kinase [Ramlibacter algicola]